ncbi:hypothetical protein E2C01_101326 [Portunus trituberculatus]|uniref:DUF4371 domain-containing protein n=1 Tax=Portunus trituberculatus TaxID=210409 RepID=A0A5B7KFB4_PORTR|nr:hypothetical protein [Portunus trituberculatus]
MFPDSAIAQGMSMKKTKCTDLTRKLSKCVTAELVNKLKQHKFSVIVDESTDVGTTKCLTVLVKYYDPDTKMGLMGLQISWGNVIPLAAD